MSSLLSKKYSLLVALFLFVLIGGCSTLQRTNPLDTTTTTSTTTTSTTTTSTTTTSLATTTTTILSGTAPSKPTGFSVTNQSGKVKLTWNANPESNISGYNIYRDTTGYSGYQKMNAAIVTGTTYEDTLVTAYHTYYYKITAVNSDGLESSYSVVDSGYSY